MARRSRKNPYKQGDRFNKRAKEEGFKARSVYKLDEAQRRFHFLAPGQRVVDLGCYPGSWTQLVLQKVGPTGTVVGVDLKAPDLPGATFLARSVMDVTAEELREALGGPADVLVSDMAPPTVGVAFTDHVRQMVLVRRATELALDLLGPGGAFFVKVFDGEEVPEWQDTLRPHFGKTKRLRPEAVRRESREFYLLAMNRRFPTE